MEDNIDEDYPVTFEDCTCEHDPEDHDWVKCEKCDCIGHWTE